MKNRPWLKYLLYLLSILALIYLDAYVIRQQAIYQSETFNIGIPYHITSMFIKIAIGSILGLEYITNEKKKEGKWKINLPKMVLMVIPCLYFSLTLFYYFIPNEFLINLLMKPAFIISQGQFASTSTFQILLGYFFITSFHKRAVEI